MANYCTVTSCDTAMAAAAYMTVSVTVGIDTASALCRAQLCAATAALLHYCLCLSLLVVRRMPQALVTAKNTGANTTQTHCSALQLKTLR
jgi:hypothetical protein